MSKLMPYQTYPYELPPLPYPYEALEPVISSETLHYHHDKHFQTYVNNLNEALKPYPYLQRLTLEQLLATPALLPAKSRRAILHNGGGVYNHALYFSGLSPASSPGHLPQGKMAELIDESFHSFDDFKATFTQSALNVFGSGWTVLVMSSDESLHIVNLRNQDTLLSTPVIPLLYVDVWEHAYYLDYKNLRAQYLNNIWSILLFPVLP